MEFTFSYILKIMHKLSLINDLGEIFQELNLELKLIKRVHIDIVQKFFVTEL